MAALSVGFSFASRCFTCEVLRGSCSPSFRSRKGELEGSVMARVLIVGGGFGGVVAAESLAKKLGRDHEITLVSRSRKFLFYPALVRFAFGRYQVEDISFDLREALLDRRIRFVEGEIARINPHKRHVTFSRGDLIG